MTQKSQTARESQRRRLEDGQLNLPPSLLANGTPSDVVRPKHTQDALDTVQAQALAAQLFDEALTDAKLLNKEVAYLLGVSESLVRRWRSTDARERASSVQQLRLPLSFHVGMHRAMNRHYGFDRAALIRLLEATGAVAFLVGK